VHKDVVIMWKNKVRSLDWDGIFGSSVIKHVTSQKSVAYDFQYDPHTNWRLWVLIPVEVFRSLSIYLIFQDAQWPSRSAQLRQSNLSRVKVCQHRQSHHHLPASCVDNLGASMSHSPLSIHSLRQG
jgi:hypothetical protein